ncbi:FHA domain-containing protein [uncultured Microscilla sp.]|uniref:FHA domain-containing protein n=1 Tax=uncultured Microscilla sp. TaxID=432653 RepID=UPI00260995AB|nr:FHA domain-containing protein [uncultured Microscilla sp.]
MDTITCISCRQEVSYQKDYHCSNCGALWWGYENKDRIPSSFLKSQQNPLGITTSFHEEIAPPPSSHSKNMIIAWLVVHTENQPTLLHELKQGKYVIGRAIPGNIPDITLNNDQFASRKHAELKVGTHEIYIVDLESRNGVYVNGQAQSVGKSFPQALSDGDTIQVGETKMVLKTRNVVQDEITALKTVRKLPYTPTVRVKAE